MRKNLFDLTYTQDVSGVDILKDLNDLATTKVVIPSLFEIDMICGKNTVEQGRSFETIVRNLYSQNGYEVRKPEIDKGIDFIFIDIDGNQIGVQVKHVYGGKEYADLRTLRSFPQALAMYGLDMGIFVTNGTYKSSHQSDLDKMSRNHNISWVDRHSLHNLIQTISSPTEFED